MREALGFYGYEQNQMGETIPVRNCYHIVPFDSILRTQLLLPVVQGEKTRLLIVTKGVTVRQDKEGNRIAIQDMIICEDIKAIDFLSTAMPANFNFVDTSACIADTEVLKQTLKTEKK